MIIGSIYYVLKGLPIECLGKMLLIFQRSMDLSRLFSRNFSYCVSVLCWFVDKPKQSRSGGS